LESSSGSFGGTLGVEGFLVASRPLSQKAHPTLSDPQPRLAIKIVPCGTRLLLGVGSLTAIVVIVLMR